MAERSREETILAFLLELWPEGVPVGTALALFTIETQAHRLVGELAAAAKLLAQGTFACFGCGLVRADAHGRGMASDARAIPGLWLDLDLAGGDHAKSALPTLEEALEFIDSLPLPPTFVLHSGGGLYLWWAFREPWVFETEEERAEAQRLVEGWQAFVREQAAAREWDLDNTSSLNQLLRADGSLNTKYTPPRTVRRIRTGGPRWNPTDFDEWRAQGRPKQRAVVDLPRHQPSWLVRAVEGLGVRPREVRCDGQLRGLVLELCPSCGGVQHTRRGLARWTAHVAPLTGTLRCKRQSCDARASDDGGGFEPALWIHRFLPPDVAAEVQRLRVSPKSAFVGSTAAADANTVALAEADAGKLAMVIDEAIEFSQSGRRSALVVATLGAGKTRIIAERLAQHRGAYFARNHGLLEEVARELEQRGVPFMHVRGVGEACHFRDAYEFYGRRPDWRVTACWTCPHKEDGTCKAWDIPEGTVILAPHASLPVLHGTSVIDPATGLSLRALSGRLVVLDEGADYVETLVLDRERLRAPLNIPGAFGALAEVAEKVTLMIDALLTRCIRRRLEDPKRSEFPSRYGGDELRALWSEATAEWGPDRVDQLLGTAANLKAKSWPRPYGKHLRERKLAPEKLSHPDLRKLWRVLAATVVGAQVQGATGRLEVVATDTDAQIEIRAPWRIPLSRKSGVVVLDATGHLTLAELQAANPRMRVREFVLNVLPSAAARVRRVHLETRSVSRRRLVKDRSISPRGLGTLRNALREVGKEAREHLGLGRHRCALITYKIIADLLVENPALRRIVAPPWLDLHADLIGYYGRDERGSNRFAGVQVLVTFGDPVPNIGAAEADGRVLDVPVQALIDGRTAATLLQAHGRSRSLRAQGPVLHAHVGRVRPPDWKEYKLVGLPPGHPPSEAREKARLIVEVLLGYGEVAAAPIVSALLSGALVPGDPLFRTAYQSSIGSSERTPPPLPATLHRWVAEDARGLEASSRRIRLPDSAWTVWSPAAMSAPEAEERARRWWDALHPDETGAGSAEGVAAFLETQGGDCAA